MFRGIKFLLMIGSLAGLSSNLIADDIQDFYAAGSTGNIKPKLAPYTQQMKNAEASGDSSAYLSALLRGKAEIDNSKSTNQMINNVRASILGGNGSNNNNGNNANGSGGGQRASLIDCHDSVVPVMNTVAWFQGFASIFNTLGNTAVGIMGKFNERTAIKEQTGLLKQLSHDGLNASRYTGQYWTSPLDDPMTKQLSYVPQNMIGSVELAMLGVGYSPTWGTYSLTGGMYGSGYGSGLYGSSLYGSSGILPSQAAAASSYLANGTTGTAYTGGALATTTTGGTTATGGTTVGGGRGI
jgi:hypothetical protein